MLDGDDPVVVAQHVLVLQIADRQPVRPVADRHHGDDLLPVQEQGERTLDRDPRLDRRARLVDAGDGLRQRGIVRVRQDDAAPVSGRIGRPGHCGAVHGFAGRSGVMAETCASGARQARRAGDPTGPEHGCKSLRSIRPAVAARRRTVYIAIG